ncbi:hypothetical protein FHS52_001086 [Erythromicrobium ramosum]|uniref:Uncharacterized protein n=1 Tax=Erythrobacter ramosus TaxID=35811 RepID=A0A6I4UIR3_9SPHN|nr:hypothetical protein [Erythrobacter ramosus]MBB3775143.1 hypothetical protein [Erythrobacter ramosus]MXP37229.1 hypothetical protein [Erythrobacter ramosus]
MRDFITEVREALDAEPELFGWLYRSLRWDQKAQLLKAIIGEGDHPPGFRVSFDVSAISEAERNYVNVIGVAPKKDPESGQ